MSAVGRPLAAGAVASRASRGSRGCHRVGARSVAQAAAAAVVEPSPAVVHGRALAARAYRLARSAMPEKSPSISPSKPSLQARLGHAKLSYTNLGQTNLIRH